MFFENYFDEQLCLIFVGSLCSLSIYDMLKENIFISDYPSYNENKSFVFKYDSYLEVLFIFNIIKFRK